MNSKLEIKTKKYRGDTMVISARVPEDLVEAIDKIAKECGRTRNEVIQLCLEFATEHAEVK